MKYYGGGSLVRTVAMYPHSVHTGVVVIAMVGEELKQNMSVRLVHLKKQNRSFKQVCVCARACVRL